MKSVQQKDFFFWTMGDCMCCFYLFVLAKSFPNKLYSRLIDLFLWNYLNHEQFFFQLGPKENVYNSFSCSLRSLQLQVVYRND